MRKTFDIQLRRHFGDPVPMEQMHKETNIAIRHAIHACYQCGDDEAIFQEFDGRNGYLYSIDPIYADQTFCGRHEAFWQTFSRVSD